MKKILLLMVLISLFMVGIVNAIPSLTLRTTTWGENSLVNVTLSDGENVTYVTLYAACSDTANSSVSLVYNITNSSTTDDSTNFNWGSANFTFGSDLILEDSKVCSVTGTTTGNGKNGDAGGVSLSATTVLVDRTKPQTPTTTQADKSTVKSGDTITYTVVGANTTRCRISFLTGSTVTSTGTNSFPMTHSGDSCTYTLNRKLSDGVYNLYAWASDETNSTFSSRININVDTISSDTVGIGDGYQVDVGRFVADKVITNQNTTIAIIIITLYLVFVRKKRR